MSPLCASMISRHSASPSPVPPIRRVSEESTRKNFVKILSRCVLDRVGEQVREHLCEPVALCDHRQRPVGKVERQHVRRALCPVRDGRRGQGLTAPARPLSAP
jgi:hypothetical protein